ncbi:MAG: helix-turn-helix domain-containing protein [Bacteroidales bacterium]|nr:helix-turn-helix domain-containing protein [Bacteroidales bacterium]
MAQESIAERIKLIREYFCNGNNRTMSQITQYSENSLSSIINGKTPCTDKFIRRILEVFPSVNPYWLREGIGDMKIGEPKPAPSYDMGSVQMEFYKNTQIELYKELFVMYREKIEMQRQMIEDLRRENSQLRNMLTKQNDK